jgi:hypothetical protein
MKRRPTRLQTESIAEDQPLVIQHAKGAGERDAIGEAAGICENPISEGWEGQLLRVLAKNQGQDGALHVQVVRCHF